MTEAATHDTELHRSLGRIEGKLDAVIVTLAAGDDRHERHEKRLGSLERRQAWYSGAAAAVGAIAAYIFKH